MLKTLHGPIHSSKIRMTLWLQDSFAYLGIFSCIFHVFFINLYRWKETIDALGLYSHQE